MPSELVASSVTAISESMFWVLGTAPCSSPPCTSLLRTTDGGAHFVGLPAPRASLASNGDELNTVSDVRFADRMNGWAFGGALWATHDGGASWRRVPLAHPVTALAASGGVVWAVVVDCASGTSGCGSYAVDRSPVGSDHWNRASLPGLPSDSAPAPSVGLQGDAIYLLVNHGSTEELDVSVDGGTHWQERPGPCSADLGGTLTASAGALWAVCPTGMLAALHRSLDGGRSWSVVRAPGALENSATLGAYGPQVAAVSSAGGLSATSDGAHWTLAVRLPAGRLHITYVGFTDKDVGYAIDAGATIGQLLRTDDAGAHWTVVHF